MMSCTVAELADRAKMQARASGFRSTKVMDGTSCPVTIVPVKDRKVENRVVYMT
jgi:hypothetical protein